MLGNHDTLYATGEGKQYFKNCFIEGTTDFIFGSATAFFDNCEISSKKDSFITAASTPPNTEFGFVFDYCNFTALENVSQVYLGRPWRDFAKTAIINSHLGAHILPEGWFNWNKTEAEKTTYYAEFNNVGNGASKNSRVKWSHQLSKRNVKKYTKEKVLQDENHQYWYEESVK